MSAQSNNKRDINPWNICAYFIKTNVPPYRVGKHKGHSNRISRSNPNPQQKLSSVINIYNGDSPAFQGDMAQIYIDITLNHKDVSQTHQVVIAILPAFGSNLVRMMACRDVQFDNRFGYPQGYLSILMQFPGSKYKTIPLYMVFDRDGLSRFAFNFDWFVSRSQVNSKTWNCDIDQKLTLDLFDDSPYFDDSPNTNDINDLFKINIDDDNDNFF